MAKNIEDKGIYMDPLTDFGFKRLFGNKELMINFLNGILVDIKDGIKDLSYSNTVRTGISKEDRAIIFDLYCTTGNGEQIIVEMQTISHENYKERTIYYATRLIQEQAQKGRDWNFSLCPVYSVNILNFCMDEKSKSKKYLSYIQFMDRDTHQLFYNKLTMVYLELPRFTKKENELETNVEQWAYALKYLPQLESLPTALRNEVFEKLFELARIAKLTKRQQNAYYKSLHDMSIVKFTISNMENTIAAQGNTITAQGNTITVLQNQLEAYKRKYGSLDSAKAKKPASE
jgi:predicted transposase/invertase (TIGR01784 family)